MPRSVIRPDLEVRSWRRGCRGDDRLSGPVVWRREGERIIFQAAGRDDDRRALCVGLQPVQQGFVRPVRRRMGQMKGKTIEVQSSLFVLCLKIKDVSGPGDRRPDLDILATVGLRSNLQGRIVEPG